MTLGTRHLWVPRPVPTRIVAIGLAVLAVGLVALTNLVRLFESALLAALLRVLGIRASSEGVTVLFGTTQNTTELTFTADYSVSPIIAFFVACCALVVWFRPPPLGRVAIAVAVLVAGFLLVNQLRLLLSVFSIRYFGFSPDYDVSQLLLGSLITILGFCAAVFFCFKLLIVRGSALQQGSPAWEAHA